MKFWSLFALVFVFACGDPAKIVPADMGTPEVGLDGGVPEVGLDAEVPDQARWQEQALLLDLETDYVFGGQVAVSQGTVFASTEHEDEADNNKRTWQLVSFTKRLGGDWSVQDRLRGPEIGSESPRLAAMIATGASVWLGERASTTSTAGLVRRFSSSLVPNLSVVSAPPDARSFGAALAADGDWLFVADPETRGGGTVHVYRVGTASAAPHQILQAPAPGEFDRFGAALALMDGRLLVGSPTEQRSGAGRAYEYELLGDRWSIQQTHEPADQRVQDLGASVAWLGTRPLIGAPESTHCVAECFGNRTTPGDEGCLAPLAPCRAVGSVFIGNGSQPDLLSPAEVGTDANFNQQFGTSVAVSEDWLVVGAQFDPSCSVESPQSRGCGASGTVHVFRRTETGLEPFRYLKTGDVRPRAHFGKSVAAEGSVLVVGAPNHCGAPEEGEPCRGSGAVYIFEAGDDPGS